MITLEEIMNTVDDIGSDSHHVGGKFIGGMFIQQIKDEIGNLILDLLNTDKKFNNYLEIGAATGGNVWLMNKYFKFKNITIVDDNLHHRYEIRRNALKNVNHNEIIGNSQLKETIKKVDDLNLKYDIIFIDGDHSTLGVTSDTKNYIHLLNKGGYIFYHDIIACQFSIGVYCKELEQYNEYDLIKIKEYLSKILPPCGIALFQKI